MKTRLLLLTFLSSSLLRAVPPEIGTTADDITFSVAEDFSGGSFSSLSDSSLSNRSGKILLLAYATPW